MKDLRNKENIVIEYINIKSMIVDLLTKRLRPIIFKKHIKSMGILRSFETWLYIFKFSHVDVICIFN